ncbi:MAG: hypothetical protein PWQ22_1643 [Archaeoglobaceae archaeon]|nr:hypothetical protein [Archaeoglobaceae archaeon]MDK2877233.1 hypothetical protein [Archaeoglobaceae archaeon]
MTEKLNFDPEFIQKILGGSKRTTVRRGIKSYPVGRIVELTANEKSFALAKIRKVVVKRLSEISEEDAKLDGFESREELIKKLKEIYGDISDKEFFTVVHFEVLSQSPQT